MDREVAAILTRHRRNLGISIPRLAQNLEWSESKTGMKLRSERALHLHDLIQIADVLGVPAWQVLREAQATCGADPVAQVEPQVCAWKDCDAPLPPAADGRVSRSYCSQEHWTLAYNARQAEQRRARRRTCVQCGGPIPASEPIRAELCGDRCRRLRRAERQRARYRAERDGA